MSRRSVLLVKCFIFCSAFLLMAAPVLAGNRVKAPGRPTVQQPAAPPVVRITATSMSFVVAVPAQPAVEPVYVNLRGPDGEMRRFLVSGGREAIEYRQVVLRPGESVSIQLVTTK